MKPIIKKTNMVNQIRAITTKSVRAVMLAIPSFFILSVFNTVYAAEGGNPLMDSAPIKGLFNFLKDAGLVLMAVSVLLGAVLIGVFSLIQAGCHEPHDKEKWGKNRKTVIISMCWVFGASSVMTLISTYLK